MYDSAAAIEYAFENEQPVSEHVIPYILPMLIGKMDHRWNAIQPKRDHQESADAVPSRGSKARDATDHGACGGQEQDLHASQRIFPSIGIVQASTHASRIERPPFLVAIKAIKSAREDGGSDQGKDAIEICQHPGLSC